MEITGEGNTWVEIDDRLYIKAVNHFSGNALKEVRDALMDSSPDIIAIEEYEEKFISTQFEILFEDIKSENGIALFFALNKSIPLALIDYNWLEVENYNGVDYQTVVTNAFESADIEEEPYGNISFREFSKYDNAIAEYDSEFYLEFVAKRDLQMASHLAWLLNETEHEEIFSTVGIAHLKNVLEILTEIDEGKANTEIQKPPILIEEELTNFHHSESEVEEFFQNINAVNYPSYKNIQTQYEKVANGISNTNLAEF